MRWKEAVGAIVLLVLSLAALGLATDFMVDWLWFSSVGYRDVFLIVFTAKAGLFCAHFIGSTIPLWASASLALRFSRLRSPLLPVPFGRGSTSVRTWSGTPSE